MAMVTAADGECGFCFLKGGNLVDPRVLPCGHMTCMNCIQEQFDVKTNIGCHTCKAVHKHLTPDNVRSLPAYGSGNVALCDFCIKQGNANQPADVYCNDCKKNYCCQHLAKNSHAEVFTDHHTVTVVGLKVQDKMDVSRVCEQHKETLTGGCGRCLHLVCVKCMFEIGHCPDGHSHQLKDLDQLAPCVKPQIFSLRDKLASKEEELSSLFKTTSKSVAVFEEETQQMRRQLLNSRNEQLTFIRKQYEQMEEEIVVKRKATQAKMMDYLEEHVGKQWADVIDERLSMQQSLQQADAVALIVKHRTARDKTLQVAERTTPILKIGDVVALSQKGESREAEVEIVPIADLYISSKPPVLPFTLVMSVDTNSQCLSVHHVEDKTYVGQADGDIPVIDNNYQVTKGNVKLPSSVDCVRVHKDRMYILQFMDGTCKYQVQVSDLSGQLVANWPHADAYSLGLKLAVMSDQVVVPDRSNQRLTVYSLGGEVKKHIPCSLTFSTISICALNDDDVILSDHGSSSVSRVNIASGAAVWSCKNITSPMGVVCSRSSSVFVSSSASKLIYQLNSATGKMATTLAGRDTLGAAGDLGIAGDVIIVPVYSRNKVLYYRLG